MTSRPLELIRTPAMLPRELIYLYLLSPFVATPVLNEHFFEASATGKLRSLASNYVPFLLIPAGIHLLYRFVMPALTARAHRLTTRFFLHAIMSALTAALVAFLIQPLHAVISGCPHNVWAPPELTHWLTTCVVITWTFVLPALVVQELRSKAETERQIALRTQLEAIQSRTNPHFLFNSINTVASLIHDNPKLAEETLERLADILRYSLKSADKVSLATELEMLEDYLEIQRARLEERLSYSIDVPKALQEVKIAPLMLQPLVENAVLHGVANRIEGGHITISARSEPGRVIILVEDDGPGEGASAHEGTGIALKDLKARLKILYGERGTMTTRGNPAGGFTVELGLPRSEPA